MNRIPLLVGLLIVGSGGAAQPAPKPPPVVRVVGNEYAFVVPPSIQGGLTTIRFVNQGKEPHFFKLLRLPDGKSAADIQRSFLPNGAPVAATAAGSPAPVLPGDSAS